MPEILKFIEVDKPIPKVKEVLVKIYTVSLNVADFENLTGYPLIRMASPSTSCKNCLARSKKL